MPIWSSRWCAVRSQIEGSVLRGGCPQLARLVDGLGFELTGKDLAAYVGITTTELASLRRQLKRRAAKARASCPSCTASVHG